MNLNKTDVNTCLALVAPLAGTPSTDLRREVMGDLFVVGILYSYGPSFPILGGGL